MDPFTQVNVNRQEFNGNFGGDNGINVFTRSKTVSEDGDSYASMPAKEVHMPQPMSRKSSAAPSEPDFARHSFMQPDEGSEEHYDNDLINYEGSDLDPAETLKKKQDMISRIRGWEKAGFHCSQNVTIDSPLDEITVQFNSMNRERGVKTGIQKIRSMIVGGSNIIEYGHKPLVASTGLNIDLDGWATHLAFEINVDEDSKAEYDNIFEDLYWKYTKYFDWGPEANLAFKLISSAWEFSGSKAVAQNTFGDMPVNDSFRKKMFNEYMKDNPQEANQYLGQFHDSVSKNFDTQGMPAPQIMSQRPMQTRGPQVGGLAGPDMGNFDMSKLLGGDDTASHISNVNGRNVMNVSL